MFKKIAAVALALCLVLTAMSCLAESAPETLTVELEGNPTTGYEWTASCDKDGIVSVESRYTSDATDEALCGVGGEYTFTVTGVAAGEVTVSFAYGRSWEDAPISTVVYQLSVDEQLNVTVASMDKADAEKAFSISLSTVPEGYTTESYAYDGVQYITLRAEDKPTYMLGVSNSEYFDASYTLCFAELADEEVAELYDILTEGYNTPCVTFEQAPNGEDMIIVEEDEADSDYALVLTIRSGYILGVDIYGDEELTDADYDLAESLLTDVVITVE